MKITDKVKIGAFDWKVVYNQDLCHDRNEKGCMRPKNSQIDIDPSFPITSQEETFIHEIIEAIVAQYNIDIEHKDLSIMATVLHQVIKDNPDIFKDGD